MRIALGIEYDGSSFHGWQRQLEVNSVQQTLEAALSNVANQKIEVVCAGRTDTGVHATGQVVHFDCDIPRKTQAWTLGVNTNLPDTISVRWAKEVSEEFHARYSATARQYRYIIYNNRLRPAILRNGLSHYYHQLDEKIMHEAGQYLLGYHNFTSFRAIACQSKTPFRTIEHLKVTRLGDYITVDIKANAFLHHMVRNIVGSLISVGQGDEPITWLRDLLDSKDRALASATSKPGGLYLVKVDYPEVFNLPEVQTGPLFLSD